PNVKVHQITPPLTFSHIFLKFRFPLTACIKKHGALTSQKEAWSKFMQYCFLYSNQISVIMNKNAEASLTNSILMMCTILIYVASCKLRYLELHLPEWSAPA